MAKFLKIIVDTTLTQTDFLDATFILESENFCLLETQMINYLLSILCPFTHYLSKSKLQ